MLVLKLSGIQMQTYMLYLYNKNIKGSGVLSFDFATL